MGSFPAISCAKASARSMASSYTQAASISLTLQAASSCVRPCAQAEYRHYPAVGRAIKSMAAPLPAPVRMAVNVLPSSNATARPVSASSTSTAAWMKASPRLDCWEQGNDFDGQRIPSLRLDISCMNRMTASCDGRRVASEAALQLSRPREKHRRVSSLRWFRSLAKICGYLSVSMCMV